MPAILRIDVDRAYENRILHYARVNQHFLLEKEPVLRKHVSIHLFGGDLT